MDKNKYSVDDILEEIKRKKMVKQRIDPEEYSAQTKSSGGSPEKNDYRQGYYDSSYQSQKYDNSYQPAKTETKERNFSSTKQYNIFPKKDDVKEYKPSARKKEVHEYDVKENYNYGERQSETPREEHQIGASIAELMEKEYSTTNNHEYFQGTDFNEEEPEEKPSSRLAGAFGQQAYKPYENKASANLHENHKKFFSKSRGDDEKPAPKVQIDKSEYTEEPFIPPKTAFTKPAEEPPAESRPAEKTPFKVNLKDNFFDQDDKENTQMNIPIKNMDSSKAAMGFTRNLPNLGGGEEPQKKRKILSFGGSGEEKQAADDYNSPEDKSLIAKDIKKSQIWGYVQLGITAVIFAGLMYWAFALENVNLPLPPFMLPEENMQMFVGMSLIMLIVNALVCNSIVGGGLISLFTLKPDNDTAAALAVIATITQGVALVALPEKMFVDGVNMYFVLASLALLFNLIGKIFMYGRVKRNFKFLSAEGEKYTMGMIKNKSLEKELTRGQNIDNPCIAYSSKTKFPTEFLQLSYSEDYAESISKITMPVFLGFSVLVSILTYFFGGDNEVLTSLTVFSAMMCVCAPLTSTIVGNLPLNAISKALTKDGAMIAGYQTLDDFDEVTTISIDANDLFAGGTLIMHGIKTFSNSRIDEAIIDAASVTGSTSGILMDIFMEMIQHKQAILKKVDNVIYEDEMGISAWVDGKKVLIGNRNLMLNHGITPPEVAYENKFKKDGREIIYLSNSGELTAMFVISYSGSEEMKEYLDKLAAKGVTLAVYTTDPNITAVKIEQLFDFPEDMITVMNAKNHTEFNEISCDKEKAPAKLVYTGTLQSKIRAICAVITGKSAVVLGTILQLVGIVLGYGLITFFAFMGNMSTATFEFIMIYQIICAFLVTLIPNIRKY